jgi:uncharacterized membrane protein
VKQLRRLWWGGALLGVLLLAAMPAVAHADVSDFDITQFSADDTLTKADPQGELHIVEDIAVDFHDYNHGILRAIPNTYAKHRLQLHVNRVSSPSGAPAKFTSYQSNGNTVLKIGSPSQTVTGEQEYIIDYTVRNVITFFGDHDELYWNINGDQWPQSAEVVRVTMHLPEGVKRDNHAPTCYTGARGSTDHLCVAYLNDEHTLTSGTINPLDGYQTLSVVLGLQKGYFQPSKWYETFWEYGTGIVQFALPFVLLAGAGLVYWFRRGRDAKGRGVIVPEYEAPDGLKPIEVGTLIDFKTDNRDITATIIDLAIRGYIKIIEETKNRKLLPDVHQYTLELTKDDAAELTDFERKLLQALFTPAVAGAQTSLTTMKTKLYKTASTLRKDMSKSLIARGYFRPGPFYGMGINVGGAIWSAAWVGGIVLSVIHSAPAITVGCIAGLVVCAVFLYFSPSRTVKGVEAKEHILGLKMYLEVAEADRIKMLQSPDARYAAHSSAPVKTVELFEKLLPYAMALGVEKGWAKQFENIYQTPPDWYSGNWTTFNVIYLTSSLNSGVGAAINTAFSAPSSSGGSGFGGGAGGGGGGGGGGGW